jgi:senataxin
MTRKWHDEALVQFENSFNLWDFARLDTALSWARDLIDKEEAAGRTFSKKMLGDRAGHVLLAIYEAMCCMAYLSLPQKRALFQYVFKALSGKKPLKLGAGVLLPAMTQFLFDGESTRQKFARAAWSQINSVSEAQFEWAIQDTLVAQLRDIAQYGPNHHEAYPQIQRFWEAFVTILGAFDENRILHSLRGMEVKPTVYDLLFQHIRCNSEGILVNIIKALSGLLHKSPKAFWDAIGDARPIVIAEGVLSAPLFKILLSQSLELNMESDNTEVPFTISWIPVWLDSIRQHLKTEACEALLQTLFEQFLRDSSIGEQG